MLAFTSNKPGLQNDLVVSAHGTIELIYETLQAAEEAAKGLYYEALKYEIVRGYEHPSCGVQKYTLRIHIPVDVYTHLPKSK